jgi:hypothetical protein
VVTEGGLTEGGLSEDQVHDAVRIAATIHAAAVSLDMVADHALEATTTATSAMG